MKTRWGGIAAVAMALMFTGAADAAADEAAFKALARKKGWPG